MSLMFWNSDDAVKATGGTSTRTWQANRAEIDSRICTEGSLFFALPGEHHDGHKFVVSALERGASAAIVSHIPEGVAQDAPLLIVPDVAKALWDLAAFNRARMTGRVIAVTGSVGKTSSKEMLKTMLSKQGNCYATEGNFNNHLGVPLSLCRCAPDVDYAIFEMGMNHAGEITPLSKLAKPHVSMITTVEAVHLEFFNSVAEIADAKAEIFAGTSETAIIPADNEHAERLRAQARNISNTLSFGESTQADMRLIDYNKHNVTAQFGGEELRYTLSIPGKHHALNSLGILAGIGALGADIKQAASDLKNYHGTEGRGALQTIEWEGIRFTLMDDSYNASPASIRAGIAVLEQSPGRKIAVLGEMRELGSQTNALHEALAPDLKNIDRVITAVGAMKHLHDALPEAQCGPFAETADALLPVLRSELKNGDYVLIKGSHGSNLYTVAEYLKNYAV